MLVMILTDLLTNHKGLSDDQVELDVRQTCEIVQSYFLLYLDRKVGFEAAVLAEDCPWRANSQR